MTSAVGDWRILDFSQGTKKANLDRLPAAPAVYAFSPNVRILTGIRGDALKERLQHLCSSKHGPEIDVDLGFFERATLRSESGVEFAFLKSSERLSAALEDAAFLSVLQNTLDALQHIVPPLYVGETKNLQARISSHMRDSSPLRARLGKEHLSIDELVLRYVLINDFPYEDGDEDGTERLDVAAEEEQERDDDDIYINAFSFSGEDDQGSEDAKFRRLVLEELVTRVCRPMFIEKLGGRRLFI